MGNSASVIEFKDQDYQKLRKVQKEQGALFFDGTFPEKSSVPQWLRDKSDYQLLRASDLSKCPCLFSPNAHVIGLSPGFVENPNIIYAFSMLQTRRNVLMNLFPNWESQKWKDEERHEGIFKVRFWECGHSVDVVIDDLMPCINQVPAGTRSKNMEEMWPLLLEKAYAKFLGSYDALEVASLDQILLDLTGGVIECKDLTEIASSGDMKRFELFDTITRLIEQGGAVICFTNHANSVAKEKATIGSAYILGDEIGDTGLLSGCGYLVNKTTLLYEGFTIMDVLKRAISKGPPSDRLLRLKAFAGVGKTSGMWRGAYSQNSTEFLQIDEVNRTKMGIEFENEQEFWINLRSFFEHFTAFVVCRWPRTKLIDQNKGKLYEVGQHFGSWNGISAGGDLNNKSTFMKNPQFGIHVDDGEPVEVLISMNQVCKRDPNTEAISDEVLSIGFTIMRVEWNRRTRVNLLSNCQVLFTQEPKSFRSIFGTVTLEPGRYVLIPYTQLPGLNGSFLLRIFMPSNVRTFEITDSVPVMNPLVKIFKGGYRAATRMTILECHDLTFVNKDRLPPSPYCVICCESEEEKTLIKRNTANPHWDSSYLFYRCKPVTKPLSVTIMSKTVVGFDQFLGRFEFTLDQCSTKDAELTVPLGPKPGDDQATIKGSVKVRFQHVDANSFDKI